MTPMEIGFSEWYDPSDPEMWSRRELAEEAWNAGWTQGVDRFTLIMNDEINRLKENHAAQTKLILDAKDHWRDRAIDAESQLGIALGNRNPQR